VKDEQEEEFSVSQGEEEDPVVEPPRKRLLLDLDEGSNSSQDIQSSLSVRRSARQPVGEAPKEDEKGVLRECLFYIQKNLQRYVVIKWIVPQLSIMIIYNSTWSIFIQ